MIYEIPWLQFQQLDYIRRLPLHEQIRKYNAYLEDMASQMKALEVNLNLVLEAEAQQRQAIVEAASKQHALYQTAPNSGVGGDENGYVLDGYTFDYVV